MTPAQIG